VLYTRGAYSGFRRAGRFGTKGLAITFVSSESDSQVLAAIQSRFEVAVPELPDHIDPASYSMSFSVYFAGSMLTWLCSDFLIVLTVWIPAVLCRSSRVCFCESVTVPFRYLRLNGSWHESLRQREV
jgi:hypothetical protein